jgi:hypothetical protein
MNRHRALDVCLRMIISENRCALSPDHALKYRTLLAGAAVP